jgi:hypothetical protein
MDNLLLTSLFTQSLKNNGTYIHENRTLKASVQTDFDLLTAIRMVQNLPFVGDHLLCDLRHLYGLSFLPFNTLNYVDDVSNSL